MMGARGEVGEAEGGSSRASVVGAGSPSSMMGQQSRNHWHFGQGGGFHGSTNYCTWRVGRRSDPHSPWIPVHWRKSSLSTWLSSAPRSHQQGAKRAYETPRPLALPCQAEERHLSCRRCMLPMHVAGAQHNPFTSACPACATPGAKRCSLVPQHPPHEEAGHTTSFHREKNVLVAWKWRRSIHRSLWFHPAGAVQFSAL